MSSAPETFLAACLGGRATPDQIDDWVGRWHQSQHIPEVELHDALGLTLQEYSMWLKNPDAIHTIIENHRAGHATLDREPLCDTAGTPGARNE